jgi:hypothetical protein
MSVQTYGYEAHFTWKWHRAVDIWAIEDMQTVTNKLSEDMRTAFLAQFAEKLAAEGHWFRVDNVTTKFTRYQGGYTFGIPIPGYAYDVEGETTIFFQSDIKDATAHNSPQLWGELQNWIWSVMHWLAEHPGVTVAILAFGILTILTIWLINTITGAINDLGKSPGGFILTLGILGVAGITIYALFFRKNGGKARRKAYQVGRRTYRAVTRSRRKS